MLFSESDFKCTKVGVLKGRSCYVTGGVYCGLEECIEVLLKLVFHGPLFCLSIV